MPEEAINLEDGAVVAANANAFAWRGACAEDAWGEYKLPSLSTQRLPPRKDDTVADKVEAAEDEKRLPSSSTHKSPILMFLLFLLMALARPPPPRSKNPGWEFLEEAAVAVKDRLLESLEEGKADGRSDRREDAIEEEEVVVGEDEYKFPSLSTQRLPPRSLDKAATFMEEDEEE